MKNHIWVIKKYSPNGYFPFSFAKTRGRARFYAKFYNGFAKGKNRAFRVRKYEEVVE